VLRFKNAAGGSFEESIRINVMLRDCGRKVIAHVEQAASAATVVACAASEVTLVEGGEYMIHSAFIKPSGFANYRSIGVVDLQLAIDQLIEANELILDVYSKRTGADRKAIAELMRLTTFLKPEDALRHGFIDRIVPALPQPETAGDACPRADCPRRGKADVAH
jgi:ATP-dependent Clp protease, protease subunit